LSNPPQNLLVVSKIDSRDLIFYEINPPRTGEAFSALVRANNLFLSCFSGEPSEYFDREIRNISLDFQDSATSGFKLFFKNLNIDTPVALNQTKSLKRAAGRTDLVRLVRYLSRHGKW
jgi:hypothetical protein